MRYSDMSKLTKAAFMAFLLAGGTAALSACDEGAFEDAGEEIDDAVDDAEDEL